MSTVRSLRSACLLPVLPGPLASLPGLAQAGVFTHADTLRGTSGPGHAIEKMYYIGVKQKS